MAIISLAVFYVLYLFIPTLHTEKNSQNVQIKTLFLGEYYSSIEKLDIYEVKSNKIVVSFKAKNESARMHTVTIRLGRNKFDDMYLNDYIISYPTSNNYQFKVNTPYKVVAQWSLISKEVKFNLTHNKLIKFVRCRSLGRAIKPRTPYYDRYV